MLPPPPTSTLFPYTTLFRSAGSEPGRKRATTTPTPTIRGPGSSDRKSTRLNSSHTVISYAVFCLKKKNRQSELHRRRDYAGPGLARHTRGEQRRHARARGAF